MKSHDQKSVCFQLLFLKKSLCNQALGLFIIVSVMLTGCVSVSPHQELLEDMVEEKIGACNLDTAELSRYFIDHENYLNPENISVLNWNIHKNKAENWLDDIEYFRHTDIDLNTWSEDDLGLAWGSYTEEFKHKGQSPEKTRIRFTCTYKKYGDKWRLIMFHKDIQPFTEEGLYLKN